MLTYITNMAVCQLIQRILFTSNDVCIGFYTKPDTDQNCPVLYYHDNIIFGI